VFYLPQLQLIELLDWLLDAEKGLTVNTPPSNGPATDAIPHMPPRAPMKVGLLCSGTTCARMIRAPENMPAAPIPAIARPTISPILDGVTPQTKDPNSNMLIDVMKTYLIEKVEYSLPYRSWKAPVVSK
jgi:hypothetical protein